MNKVIKSLFAVAICAASTVSMADVTFGAKPTVASNGEDFVGDIIAASYDVFQPNDVQPMQRSITIILKADKLNASTLKGATLEFTGGADLALGQILAGSIGKKVAVSFDENFNISRVSVITDEYWTGSGSTKK